MLSKSALILPYYGSYPIWMNAFLRSCAYNPSLTWLIFSDLEKPMYQPDNVQFFHLEKEGLSELIKQKTGIHHALENPHKLCDFKPLYGHIFEDYLVDYQFWGHCDMDVIWGDMDHFLFKMGFEQFDLVSSRPHAISGHFTLYRNMEALKVFYQSVPQYHKAFIKPNYQGFDEGFYSYHIFNEVKSGRLNIKPYWEKRNCIDRGELHRHPGIWIWEKGKIHNRWGLKGNYLHLIDWKRTLREVNLANPEQLNRFSISAFGLWKGRIPWQYQRRLFFRWGFRKKYQHWKNRLKTFVKHQLLHTKNEIEANVPEGYKTLN